MDKAAFANRRWNGAMVRFLLKKRRQGYPIRWIAQRLGVSLVRAVAQAINRGLVMRTAYRGRRCTNPPPPELPPLGPIRDLPQEGLCRWMNANPDEDWAMCARETNGGAWCNHHRAQVYAPRLRAHTVPHPSRGSRRSPPSPTSRWEKGNEFECVNKNKKTNSPSPVARREKVASAERETDEGQCQRVDPKTACPPEPEGRRGDEGQCKR